MYINTHTPIYVHVLYHHNRYPLENYEFAVRFRQFIFVTVTDHLEMFSNRPAADEARVAKICDSRHTIRTHIFK